ncbi:MAG: nucleoside-diphosphate-sugar pyrophosphorylase, partial [Acidimicrobiia bacterium]
MPSDSARSESAPRVAVVFAGGEGTRLQPYTTVLPKPLMPLGDKPIIEIILRQLGAAGFEEVILAVGYLAELIQTFVGNGHRFGVRVRYSMEVNRLGTAGPLSQIDDLPDDFLVMNGDVLSDLDYASLFESHLSSNAALTVAAYEKRERIDFGVLEIGSDTQVISFREKPSVTTYISTGIYAVSREAISLIPKGQKLDFPDFIMMLLDRNIPVRAFFVKGVWLDIGRK